MNNLINIQDKDGQLLVSSREIAKNFEKRNSDVNRAIENLVKETSVQNCTHLFISNQYKDTYGREQEEYLLTRDGFSLLVMGFTGKKALDWKLKYIDAFNKMEQALKEQTPQINSKFLYQLAGQLEEKEKQIALQGQIIGELKPKADYTDRILKNKGLVTITQIAKDYGMSGQWLLYREHQGKGYTHSETIDIVRKDGSPDIRMNTKWTQKGRLFLYELLKQNDIFPDIEKIA